MNLLRQIIISCPEQRNLFAINYINSFSQEHPHVLFRISRSPREVVTSIFARRNANDVASRAYGYARTCEDTCRVHYGGSRILGGLSDNTNKIRAK